jgi:predicted transposase YdaD
VGQHDLSYRLFFTHRRMIQDLLRKIVDEPWVEQIDLDSAELVNTSLVSGRHETRDSDIIWKFLRTDGKEPAHVYVVVELQSRPDASMPVRIAAYESLFLQSLLADLPPAAWRKMPLILAILVYNGGEPWHVVTDLGSSFGDPLDPSFEAYRPQWRYRLVDESAYDRQALVALRSPVADLFYIEKSRDWSEVRAGVQRLRQNIPSEDTSLRRAFVTWLKKVILPRFGLSPEEAGLSLEDLETMLAESIDRWNRQIREEGRQEGWQEGRQEGHQEGRQEGWQEGRQEGEALVVLRLLRRKFGLLAPETEERVRSADAARLLDWSERVLTAERLEDVFRD